MTSATRIKSMTEPPCPPYSSGKGRPSRPAAAHSCHNSYGYALSRSRRLMYSSVACRSISLRTASTSACCSSLGIKSIILVPPRRIERPVTFARNSTLFKGTRSPRDGKQSASALHNVHASSVDAGWSDQGGASVDQVLCPRDVSARVRYQVQNCVGDVGRLKNADRQCVECLGRFGKVLEGRLGKVRTKYPVCRIIHDHCGRDRAWMHSVYPDAVRREFLCQYLHQTDYSSLGSRVVAKCRRDIVCSKRTGQDDGPSATAGNDVRRRGTYGIEDASKVDINHF